MKKLSFEMSRFQKYSNPAIVNVACLGIRWVRRSHFVLLPLFTEKCSFPARQQKGHEKVAEKRGLRIKHAGSGKALGQIQSGMRHTHSSHHALASRPYHSSSPRSHPPPIPHPAPPAHAIASPDFPTRYACCQADTTTRCTRTASQ